MYCTCCHHNHFYHFISKPGFKIWKAIDKFSLRININLTHFIKSLIDSSVFLLLSLFNDNFP